MTMHAAPRQRQNGGEKPTALVIDGEMARQFLELLDPDHEAFLFAAGDDNQERAKAALKAKKAVWADHRHGSWTPSWHG
ncbi:MAG: hypothetical protein WAO08_13355 [Hyphomicrobiaceae bacterium]